MRIIGACVYGMLCRYVNNRFTALWGVTSAAEIHRQLQRFGANLRRERMARNVTQERLAEMADLNVRTLQKIEAGQTNILITTLLRLLKSLKCGSKALLGD